jgi:Zn-dependent protease with chaperone function
MSALAVVLLSRFPGIAPRLVPAHCHGGTCGAHVPVLDPSSLGSAAVLLATGLLLLCVLQAALRALVAGQRRVITLLALSARAPEGDLRIIDSSRPFAWCCGLLRPRVVVSRGLAELLSEAELDAVVAHERAHALRFDNLRVLLLRWATCAWPRGLRNDVRAHHAGLCESACDAHAVRGVGNREAYASLLARVALAAAPHPAAAMPFGTADDRLRAACLATEPGAARLPLAATLTLGCAWLVQVLLVTALTHFLIERLAP